MYICIEENRIKSGKFWTWFFVYTRMEESLQRKIDLCLSKFAIDHIALQ